MSTTPAESAIPGVLADGTTSDWLKTALASALQRDPVDALNDALLLAGVLEERLRGLFDLSGDEEGLVGKTEST